MSGLQCKNGHDLGLWLGGIWNEKAIQKVIDETPCNQCPPQGDPAINSNENTAVQQYDNTNEVG
jgi:hypothetical protein